MERFWVLLAKLGFWIPTSKCMPLGKYGFDWVLISYVDCKGKGVRCLPAVAEFIDTNHGWHYDATDGEIEHYHLNNDCVVTHWRKIPMEPVRRRENRRNK